MTNLIKKYGISSSDQLIDLAKKLKIKLKFIGLTNELTTGREGRRHSDLSVRSDRSLTTKKISNGSYIFNIADTTPGTHWVCSFIENNYMFYFDSFSVPPEDDLIKICEDKSTIETIIYNSDFQFQNISEQLCGIWCILFLYHMENTKGPLIERFNDFKKEYLDLSS